MKYRAVCPCCGHRLPRNGYFHPNHECPSCGAAIRPEPKWNQVGNVIGGTILFFEEVHEPTYVIEVHLDQLRLAGKLDGIAGIVIGEMKDCGWREERPETPRDRSLEDAFERHLAGLGVPVLYKLPLGHGKHLASMPLGVTATLDADARKLTIDQPGVAAPA